MLYTYFLTLLLLNKVRTKEIIESPNDSFLLLLVMVPMAEMTCVLP